MSAISVENLGKRYTLSHKREEYLVLRDALAGGLQRLAGRVLHPLRPAPARAADDEFWALRDLCFEVQHGDRVGIVGRNGAGKSTLLKILSRITEPTTGRARIRGRVVSLLEVGTGFHPELSGRENVFLNGAILGMSRQEIRKKFDEIVAFAEIERFLDTPVKRYSSGMYVRLAFAVAAHLEPEILIVDEVLAVGDAAFQKKCLGKMEDVSTREGRTVLFVSHNMQAVSRLCGRAIWLEGGRIRQDGASGAVVDAYLNAEEVAQSGDAIRELVSRLPEDPALRLTEVRLLQDGNDTLNIMTGKELKIRIGYQVLQPTPGLRVQIILHDLAGAALFGSFAHPEDEELRTLHPGSYCSEVAIPEDFLAPVGYRLGIYASIYNVRHCFAGQGVIVKFHAQETGRIKFAYALSCPIEYKLAPFLKWETTVESG